MVPDPPAGVETGSSTDGGTLIFLSDASAEAERFTTALRTRGYPVVDVPLALLISRVAVQKPSVILCDADAPGAIDTVQRLRDVPGGNRVDIIFIGEPGQTVVELAETLHHEGSGIFVRPVDVDLLVRKVEALVGPPSTRGELTSRAPPAHRAPVLVAATRRPYRYEGDSGPMSSPAPQSLTSAEQIELPLSEPMPPPTTTSEAIAPSAPSTGPISSVPPSAAVESFRSEPPASLIPQTRRLPTAKLSTELESLLSRAEQRVTRTRNSSSPPSERLSPEAEIEAILPADVLEALDEPLDLDDDEEDDDSGAGTHNSDSEHGSRGGTKTGPGSAAGGVTAAPLRETSSGAVPPIAQGETGPEPAPGSSRSPETDAPATPPARPVHHEGSDAAAPAIDPEPALANSPETHHGGGRATEPPPAPGSRDVQDAAPPTRQASTRPPRAQMPTLSDDPVPSPRGAPNAAPEIPASLGTGDSARCLARLVRARYTGALAFEDERGIRRVVFRDGDFVTTASGAEGESLVAFLAQRGDLQPDVAARLARRLPQFGRHAGAALIAQGHLRQDELWSVLRAHAEWLLGRIVELRRGAASLEPDVSARLQSEPAVFGGATGAEVLIEIVRRIVPPRDASDLIGGAEVRLGGGENQSLLGECALPDAEAELVRQTTDSSLEELLVRAGTPDFASVVYALVELGVMSATRAAPRAARPAPARPKEYDPLDHEAVRARVTARLALVEEGDYFALLGVARTATAYDIRRAYTKLCEEFDPGRILSAATADLRDDIEAILEVLDEAFEILRDDLRRDRYRRALEAPPR